MDKYTYTLKQNLSVEERCSYSRQELELMTTYQLRDICWRERIINGIQAPLDRDMLIRQIMRFRGKKEELFITKYSEKGMERIEGLLGEAKIHILPETVRGCARIIAYKGISITCADGFTIGYMPRIVDTNALLVSGGKVCAIFQVRQMKGQKDRLYLTRSAELPCKDAPVKSYQLYCMDRRQSDWIYRLYEEAYEIEPEHLNFYRVPVMDFQIRELMEMDMPLAIDFGTTNTTAGIYLDSAYVERMEGDPIRGSLKENEANYVMFPKGGGEEAPVLPSVAGVLHIQGDEVKYVFGYQAEELFRSSYIDEGFCVFYDMKRWISDPEREEELVDGSGRRCYVKRKEIIRAFLMYVISCATQRFKCRFTSLHISAPVKQKGLFARLYKEIFPEYRIMEGEDMLDEGVAVLYNSISELISERRFHNGGELQALIIDCGGGTTDLSSSRFTIFDQRIAYRIRIATAYENGDTDFGGNNLTYRIMELLKIAMVRSLEGAGEYSLRDIMEDIGTDIYRRIDREGADKVYRLLEEEYRRAEAVVPTRFKDYEHKSNADYFAVKNNFYFLFGLAEEVKKAFYGREDALRVAVGSTFPGKAAQEEQAAFVQAERFKLSVYDNGKLRMLKDIPAVSFSISQLGRLLKGDVYRIVKRFIEAPYERDELQRYSIMRLTGQSCKIGLFREALKEFIPGRIIESSRRSRAGEEEHGLKLMCLDGAIRYIRDRRFGYADVTIVNEQAAFPYVVTAFTHTGEERVLIRSLDRGQTWGYISRNMTDLTLQLFLKDAGGRQRYKYNCSFSREKFKPAAAEEIVEKYRGEIIQDDVDSIVEKELRAFVLADEERWGFSVVPILRRDEKLMLGPKQEFLFETEDWLTNFFDGTK
jgi:hypothetical protein